jgi:hypothetical protein
MSLARPCHRLLAALLVPVITAGAVAQNLALTAVAVPGRVDARVDGAAPGAIAGCVIGGQVGDQPVLPGLTLGILAPELLGLALADGDGRAVFAATFAPSSLRGLTFFAQGIRLDLAAPLTASAGASPVRSVTVPVLGDRADIVVLFGQSNAEGHADGGSLPPALRGALPRCRIWNDAGGDFAAMQHGVNTRSYGPASWCGPELTLATAIAERVGTVYVVKFALPATALGATAGPWNEWGADAGELYRILLARIDAAASRLRADGLQPRVSGIAMMQGESDAIDAALAATYRANLMQLVRKFRGELAGRGLGDTEPVPFVCGAISRLLPASTFPFVDQVRDAQFAVAAELPRCLCVDTRGLLMQADGVHFDTAAALELGRRLAAALARLR